MIQGTTPVITCILENASDIIQNSNGNLYMSISQGPIVLTKQKEDLVIEENKISTKLTQKNTLMFKPGEVKIQIKGKTSDGIVWATSICVADITEILCKKVI